MCGKDKATASAACYDVGSPPHVRERHADADDAAAGITPACAGKTEGDDALLTRL